MKILVVSDREFKETSRGIDMITSIFADKGHFVDHLVFYKRKRFPEKQVSENIRQLYAYDSLKFYHVRIQFLFPAFLLLMYFNRIIKKNSHINLNEYDCVVLESGQPLYLASKITTKIIYRQSDPTYITFKSNRKFYEKLELEVIKKSLFVSSALRPEYYPQNYNEKIHYCHSGYIPFKKEINQPAENYFIVMGGDLDWNLLNKMSKKYPEYKFYVIGIRYRMTMHKNIVSMGYLDYNNYQKLLSSTKLTIIPFSNFYTRQLQQVFFTAKIFVSMDLGKPILLRAYGDIKNTDVDKKMFVYKNHKEALQLLDNVLKNIENGELNNNVSEETLKFLQPQTIENRKKELEEIFSKYIS